jgi:hypothetical protein
MKIKANFVLRQIASVWVVLPLGNAALDFREMLTLNESGVLLWRLMKEGCDREDLVAALLTEYDVSRSVAEADADEFVEKLRSAGCLEQ